MWPAFKLQVIAYNNLCFTQFVHLADVDFLVVLVAVRLSRVRLPAVNRQGLWTTRRHSH